MVDGGLACAAIEGCGFEEDVGAGYAQPIADIFRRFPCGRLGETIVEQRGGIEADWVGDPSDAARGEAGEAPVDAIGIAKVCLFGKKQTDEFLADVAEADEREIVSANGPAPR
jgi:hypothetical protein